MPHGYVHRALYTLAALVAVGICVAAAALLWVDRRGTWDAAYVASRNLADGLAGAIGRTLHVYDLSLQGVIERLHEPGVALLATQTLHRFLFDRSASAEYLGTILVLDSDGLVRYDSASIAPPLTSFADRDFFRVHRDADDVGMYLSRPYRSACAAATRAWRSAGGCPIPMAASPAWSWARCAWRIFAIALRACRSASATSSPCSATTARCWRATRIP